MIDSNDLVAIRESILERVANAALRARRDPDTVRIVAITKTVEAERIRAAIEAGFATLGENRVQERQAKADEITRPSGTWHLVGPLQSNKARRAVELFDAIETVDSLELAERLARISTELRPAAPLPILLQVNVDEDAAKAGFQPVTLQRDLGAILELPGLQIDGLMTVGRLVETPELARPTFIALRALSERLRGRHPSLGPELSMGMSEDYAIAVEEGATLVRIGRAIFGDRRPVR